MVVCNLQVTRHHEEQRTRTTGQHAGLGEVSPANGALGAVADGDVAEHVTANDEAETEEHVELDKRVVWYVPHAGCLQLERTFYMAFRTQHELLYLLQNKNKSGNTFKERVNLLKRMSQLFLHHQTSLTILINDTIT